mmetsp:Transcript_40171/g.115980  ORF Transcript_40171/g.115980 Transcript_40171/m.115980 type:complete len:221 (+) Transcript_40171:72-734(+)
MTGSLETLIASTFEEIQSRFDHTRLVSSSIRNKLVLAWLLCVQRMKHFSSFQRHYHCAADAARIGDSFQHDMRLPLEAKKLLDAFLGDISDMSCSLLPASAFKRITESQVAMERAKLNAYVSKSLQNCAHPQIMASAMRGLHRGEVVVDGGVMKALAAWEPRARDGRLPSQLVAAALEAKGFRVDKCWWQCKTLGISASTAEYPEDPYGNSPLVVCLQWE